MNTIHRRCLKGNRKRPCQRLYLLLLSCAISLSFAAPVCAGLRFVDAQTGQNEHRWELIDVKFAIDVEKEDPRSERERPVTWYVEAVDRQKKKVASKGNFLNDLTSGSSRRVDTFLEVSSPGEYWLNIRVSFADGRECAGGFLCAATKILGPIPVARPKPKLYAVVIGIDEYQDENIERLLFTDDDAASFYRLLTEVLAVPEEQIFFLTSKGKDVLGIDENQGGRFKAFRKNITTALLNINRRVTDHDIVIVYYSGHGFRWGNDWYIAPYDADLIMPILNKFHLYNFISFDDWEQFLNMGAKRIVLIQDSCFSGEVNVNDSFRVREIGIGAIDDETMPMEDKWKKYWEQRFRSRSREALLASNPREQAYEIYIDDGRGAHIVTRKNLDASVKGHGLFTFALLNAIEGTIGIDLNDDDSCGGRQCWNSSETISDKMREGKIEIDIGQVYDRLSQFMKQYIEQHKGEMNQKVQHPRHISDTIGEPLKIVHYHLLQEGR